MTANACKIENIKHKRGTLLLIDITATDESGEPMSFAGYQCDMKALQSYGGTVILSASSEGENPGIVLADGMISIRANVEEDAPLGRGVYDIILTGADGKIAIAEGVFEVSDIATI